MWQTYTEFPAKIPFQPRAVCLVGSGDHYCAASRQSPISTNPFTYMVSLSKKSTTANTILETGEYAINFLDDSHLDAIDYSGRVYGEHENKWQKTGFTQKSASAIASPLIEQSFAIFECKVFEAKEVHDHFAFFADVVALHIRKDREYPADVRLPLFLGKGYYASHSEPQVFRSSLLPEA